MTTMTIIDVDGTHRRWVQEFTWHLDLVPVLMDTLVDATLPTIPVGLGSRFDKEQLTGGGYRDNMQILDRFEVLAAGETGGRLVGQGPAADARELWEWVTSYTTAVSSWLNHDITVPWAPDFPPTVDRRPNPDPLTARGLALVTIGWLIDRADRISELTDLEGHREEMFRVIRHLRGRYGVFNHPRRARPTLCTVCGEAAVRTTWATSKDGRARSVEVKRCTTCGDEHREDEGKTDV